MSEFLGDMLATIPADAYPMYAVMLALTVGLVRCSVHPTIFALVALPGTTMHELAHATIGKLLGARPASISLWPKALGGGQWQLGSVGFTNLTWWNAPWTAMAPMLLAPLALVLVLQWPCAAWAAGDVTSAGIGLYVCATMLQASWPSSTDFMAALPGLAVIGLIVAWLW